MTALTRREEHNPPMLALGEGTTTTQFQKELCFDCFDTTTQIVCLKSLDFVWSYKRISKILPLVPKPSIFFDLNLLKEI